eukprot:8045466-Alexandrium_andersonii.AAC.1
MAPGRRRRFSGCPGGGNAPGEGAEEPARNSSKLVEPAGTCSKRCRPSAVDPPVKPNCAAPEAASKSSPGAPEGP